MPGLNDRRHPTDPTIVAVVSMPPPITGQSTAARLLLDALDDAGVAYRVIDTASPIGTTRFAGQLRVVGRTLRSAVRLAWSSPEPGRPVVAYFQLGQGPRSMLRDLPLLATALVRGWRVVGHVHGGGWRHGLDLLPAPLRRIYLAAIARVDTIVVLTPRLAAMFDGLVDPARIRVVGNGVERHVAERALHRGAAWSAEPNVLFLSNLMRDKGFDTVLDAARLAIERNRAIRFVIAGDAVDPIDDGSWPRNCTYVGVVDGRAKEDLLARSQVLVLPTHYWVEGEPIAILEAFHFGLPVISCDQGGIADLVTPDRGCLIPPDDPAALLDAIVFSTADRLRWQALSADARATADDHSLEAHLRAMFDLLSISGRDLSPAVSA